jgi:predicted secreted Zn-dependent protease
MRNRIFSIVLIAALAFPALALSAVKTKISEEYYPISADGLSRLHWKLKRNLITDNYGNKFVAKTDWDVSWQVHTLSNTEICMVSDVIVDVAIKYTYPKWSDIAFAPSSDRQLWNKFIDALRKHEEGHALIGQEAGKMIEKALIDLKTVTNCKELEVLVRNKADLIHQEYIARDAAYDGETDHGKSQGAILP